MTPDPSDEAVEQLRLRYRLAAGVADTYFNARFSVVVEDVVAGPMLPEYHLMIRSRPCHVVVLLPSVETVAAREAQRAGKGYVLWTVEGLYKAFAHDTPRLGTWLDTTTLTPEETVAAVLASTS
jgi:chloramphenicol 3-O-phosphotransferase